MFCLYKPNYSLKVNGCKTKGGLIAIAVALFTAGTNSITFNGLANGLITGVTHSASTHFYVQAQHPEKAFANVKSDTSEDRLAGGYIAEGSIYFNNNDYLLRNSVVDLVNSQCFVIGKYSNGTYRLFGEEFGVYFNDEETSGTKLNDLNGVTMTWVSKSTTNPRFIDATLAELLFDYDTVITPTAYSISLT